MGNIGQIIASRIARPLITMRTAMESQATNTIQNTLKFADSNLHGEQLEPPGQLITLRVVRKSDVADHIEYS